MPLISFQFYWENWKNFQALHKKWRKTENIFRKINYGEGCPCKTSKGCVSAEYFPRATWCVKNKMHKNENNRWATFEASIKRQELPILIICNQEHLLLLLHLRLKYSTLSISLFSVRSFDWSRRKEHIC